MLATDLDHPTSSVLTAYSLGQLNEDELAQVDSHLAECEICREAVEGVPPDTLMTLLRSSATEPDSVAGSDVLRSPGGATTAVRGFRVPQPRPHSAEIPAPLLNYPRYKMGELLGVGGMGAVYKAEHLLMQRPVAVKVLNHELIDNPATVERFRREMRAAARLTHPNIVAAFDAEQVGDVHFLAMEYVEGASLARRCAEYGPLPVAEACDYARQAALGLQHAHECGMVHRDIKPQNLMLTPGGQVKILDFGLARFIMESAPAGALLPAEGNSSADAGPSGASERSWDGSPEPSGRLGRAVLHPDDNARNNDVRAVDKKAHATLTLMGVVMGTPDYIAPEQVQDSHQADIRADIYSLGCTLYDMLAGHAPFPDGNAVQKVKAHLHRTPPPLKTLRRDVPQELVRVVERMMAKDPAQRYQTPAEVATALAPFAAGKPPRRKKWPLVAAAFGFIAALALGVVIFVQTDRGTIIIETNDKDVALLIEKEGVRVVDKATQREYSLKVGERELPSGNYSIEVTDPLAGLDFQTNEFKLKRGREVRLVASMMRKGEGQAKAAVGVDRKRSQERLQILKEIAAQREAGYQRGTNSIDQVLSANREVAKLELELAQSEEERVAAHRTLVWNAQKSVEMLETLVKAGAAPQVELLKAKADLLEAETALDRAKSGEVQPAATLPGPVPRNTVPYDGFPKSGPAASGEIMYGGKPAGYWLEQLKDANPKFRAEAVEALGSIAQKNKGLIPVVANALKDTTQVARTASKALAALGADAIPAMLEVMKGDRSPTTVIYGLTAISKIGPGANAAVPFLTQILRANDARVDTENLSTWIEAVRALGAIGPGAKPAIPAIVDALGTETKSEASLIKRGSWDRSGPDEFRVRLSPSVAPFVYAALQQIDPDFKEPPPKDFAFGKTLEDAQQAALSGWQKAYEDLKKRYPTRADEGARSETVDAIGQRVRDDGTLYKGKSVTYWLERFKDASPTFRTEAVDALGNIAKKNKQVIPILIGALKDSREVARQAAFVLGEVGTDALPALIEVLKDESSPNTAHFAALAVASIGPKAKAAVPELIQVLRRPNKFDDSMVVDGRKDSTWLFAIQALAAIGQDAKPAIPAMVDAIGASLKADGAIASATQRSGMVFVRLSSTIPHSVYNALKQIDPDFKDSPPKDVAPAKSLEEGKQKVLEGWLKACEELKRRYPGRAGEGAPADIPDVEHKRELARFQGTWSVLKREERGETSFSPSARYRFDGNSLTTALVATYTGKFEIDPTTTPKSINIQLAYRGEELPPTLAIYEFDGDVLKICKEDAIDKKPRKRPTSFMDTVKTLSIVFLTRIKDSDAATDKSAASKDQDPLYAGKPASHWQAQLKDTNPKFRLEAVEALGSIVPKQKELILVLAAASKDKSKDVREKASSALLALGPGIIPALIEVLKNKDSSTAVSGAADLLGKFGRDAKAAVPLLIEAVKRNDWEARLSPIDALGRIGPEAKPAIPALIEVLGDYINTVKPELKPYIPPGFGTGKGKGKKEGIVWDDRLPMDVGWALDQIDPGGFSEVYRRTHGGTPKFTNNTPPEEKRALWQKIHEALEKRYLPPQPAPVPKLQPKDADSESAAGNGKRDK